MEGSRAQNIRKKFSVGKDKECKLKKQFRVLMNIARILLGKKSEWSMVTESETRNQTLHTLQNYCGEGPKGFKI